MDSEWVLLDFKLEHQRRTLWTGWGELPLFPIGDPQEVTDVETVIVTKDSQELDQLLSDGLNLSPHHRTHQQTTYDQFPSDEHTGAAAVQSWLNEVTKSWFAGIQNASKADSGQNPTVESVKIFKSIAAFRIAAATTTAQVPPISLFMQ
jgi:hypothetical protein